MESDSLNSKDQVAASAMKELERLEEMEDAAWFDPQRIQMPPALRVGIGLACIVLLAGFGVLLVRYPNVGLLIGLVGVVVFIWSVTKLERRYSTALTQTLLPPRRVQRRFRLFNTVVIGLPVGIGVGVGFNMAIERAAPWWIFGVIAAATITTSVLLASVLRWAGWMPTAR